MDDQQTDYATPVSPLADQNPVATISAILIAVFLLGTGTALQGTVIALRAGSEGFSDLAIGIIMSSYFSGFIAGSLLGVRFIGSVGYIRTFAGFASIASAAALAHLLLVNPVSWIILRVVHGLCTATLLVVVESWLNTGSPARSRGKILSLYSLIYLASMGVGQPLLALFPETGYELFVLVSILVSISLVPVVLANTGVPVIAERRPLNIRRAFTASRFASLGILVSGISAGALWSIGPRFAQLSGLNSSQIGLFMLMISVGALAAQAPLGFLSDRVDRRRVVLISSGIGTCIALVIALIASTDAATLSILGFVFGAFTMPLYSICLAYANDQLETSEMVAASGAYIIFYAIGSSAGPSLSGLAIGYMGPSGLFFLLSLCHGLFAVWSLLRLIARPSVKLKHKERFHPWPRTTAIAFRLIRKVNRGGKQHTDDPGIPAAATADPEPM